jgi:hypothetical protein
VTGVVEIRKKKFAADGKSLDPPTDGGGFRDFYHNWTNSILQQLKRKFEDVLFRIS